jgi:hypothetical protein
MSRSCTSSPPSASVARSGTALALDLTNTSNKGRAMAQVVSLSPRGPRFAPGSIHVKFVVDKVALGQVFLRVLRFAPSIGYIIPPSLSKTHIIWGMRNMLAEAGIHARV